MATTTTAINLSGITSVLGEIVNLFIQYLPLLATVGIIIGIINYVTGGLTGVLSTITGAFGGG